MRALFLFAGLLLNVNAFAQEMNFPVRCDERILTPKAEALCGPLHEVTQEAQEKYLYALSKVNSIGTWTSLSILQRRFMVRYYQCSILGRSDKVATCLAPAFEEFISQLPNSQINLPADLKIQASNANSLILSHAYNKLNECVIGKINKLDDGVSSARDIALGIGSSCKPKAYQIVDIIANSHTTFLGEMAGLEYQRDLTEKIISPDEVVGTVLEYRAQKRSQIQSSKKPNLRPKVDN